MVAFIYPCTYRCIELTFGITLPSSPPPPRTNRTQLDCLKFLLSLPDTNTEIENIQGKRAGEGFEELMRDESNDEETLALMKESRTRQGITRL